MSLKPLSNSLGSLSKPLFQRKYIKLGRIYNHWEEIIGPAYVDKSAPVALKFRKKSKPQPHYEAILTILSDGGIAMKLSYQKDVILGKIERIFGEKIVTDINFIQSKVKSPPSTTRAKPPLPEVQQNEVRQLLQNIKDEDLHTRLEEFATSLYQSSGHSKEDK